MQSNGEWLESLELFGIRLGLERMQVLLDGLGNPERAFRSIHVVGTNGKTSVTRMAEALLLAEGLSVGAFTSPHVTDWAERIRVDGQDADLDAALERVRPAAQELRATQFEVLAAAALAEFAASGVDAAVLEAGLGGRLDATNVVAAPVVVLTNVALEHTQHLGETREAIVAEKLGVVGPGATVVVGEPGWDEAARAAGATRIIHGESNEELAVLAASEFLGRPVDPAAADLAVPGRLERMGEAPLEIWDGAHNPAGVEYLLGHLQGLPASVCVVVSILADKDAVGMLAALARLGGPLVATSSGHDRALGAAELARHAAPFFAEVETVEDPAEAVARGRELAGPDGAVVVTGSLTLLARLAAVRPPYVR
jgi:dihydrofolate synthase / folylpolyglutamate synthase